MNRFGVSMLAIGVALAVAGCAPGLTGQGAAALDPTAQVLQLCGRVRDDGSALTSRVSFVQTHMEGAALSEDVPLVQGLGAVDVPITTSNPQAQAYFNQGLAFTYGFNHDAAVRSFRKAQQLDPQCAMCFWGEAYALGPNINAAMEPSAGRDAVKAAARAQALAGRASPKEQALIAALAHRYSDRPDADRAALDAAYEQAMRAVAQQYAADDDLQVLAAEAAMNRQPWDYWEADGVTPKGDIGRAIQAVERVLARNPDHPQAIHLYIHLMEASASPARAEPFADRLARPLASRSGHLLHMPAHIYHRVGRWKDSIAVNVAAVKADEAWMRQAGSAPSYRYAYYPHNVHFILVSAQMGGDARTALDQAARLRTVLDVETAAKLPWVQAIWAAPSFAHAQFSPPATILAQPQPDARLPYAVASWRYARAVAHAGDREADGFEAELRELRRIRETADLTALETAAFPARKLMELAETAARARRAYLMGDYAAAETLWRAALKLEDELPYNEPPYWYYPIRQSLGATLLRRGRPDEARAVFMAALARTPNNGWALYGLSLAERKLGDAAAARGADRALQAAWLGDRRVLHIDRL